MSSMCLVLWSYDFSVLFSIVITSLGEEIIVCVLLVSCMRFFLSFFSFY